MARWAAGSDRNSARNAATDDAISPKPGTAILRPSPRSRGMRKEDSVMAVIKGNALKNHLVGTGSADAIYGYEDNDTLAGNAGNDSLYGGSGNDWVQGNDGADMVYGEAGNDTLRGDAGADWLDGGTGADNMAGGTQDDTYVVDNIGDVVTEYAGQGTDTVRTMLTSYTLGAEVENLTYTGIQSFKGIGNGLDNVITGGIGNDTIDGGKGHDTLIGGAGDDTYYLRTGGTGSYMVGTSPNEMLYQQQVVEAAGGGRDTVVLTTAWFASCPAVYIQTMDVDGVVPDFIDAERMRGTLKAMADNVEILKLEQFTGYGPGYEGAMAAGNALDNIILGIDAANMKQMLMGEEGNDSIYGGSGLDALYGDAGNDLIRAGGGDDYLTGGAGNDSIFGDAGEDFVRAGTGDDMVRGGDGVDYLYGMAGNDQLFGDGMGDLLWGLAGNDTLTGGAGEDAFRFTIGDKGGADVITDFERGTDDLSIEAYDPNPSDGIAQAQPMLTQGAAAYGVWQVLTDAGLKVYADLDGDAAADIDILVQFAAGSAAGPLTEADFTLKYYYADYSSDGLYY
jgi:Ca2+-binding RTX toxin-like protein